VFGFVVWEVDFLVASHTFFPIPGPRVDLRHPAGERVLSYVLVYGPVLGAYAVLVRPGVIGDWHAVGPPAGTFAPPSEDVS